jgi:mutator protein MutT
MTGYRIRVIACVISREEELLICQRPLHKRHGGLWEFPGGKCEAGESDEVAVVRELREELGVEVVSVGPPEFTSADGEAPFEIAFVPVEIAGVPRCIEHTGLTWGRVDELLSYKLAPSDRAYLNHRLKENVDGSAR